ncbi:MAG: biopolymer transporter ExbD [Phycisphaerales bacterium]|nr:biopolymer transporter ExbD [Phycisphaerales bacterium]
MKFSRADHPREASFDLTPMIDVVFLLIIFFTLTSHFSNISLAPVKLPVERGDPARAVAPRSLILTVSREGAIDLAGRTVGPAELISTIAAETVRAGGSDQIDVIVRADRSTPAARLDPVVSALASSGVRHWKLATSGSAPREGR